MWCDAAPTDLAINAQFLITDANIPVISSIAALGSAAGCCLDQAVGCLIPKPASHHLKWSSCLNSLALPPSAGWATYLLAQLLNAPGAACLSRQGPRKFFGLLSLEHGTSCLGWALYHSNPPASAAALPSACNWAGFYWKIPNAGGGGGLTVSFASEFAHLLQPDSLQTLQMFRMNIAFAVLPGRTMTVFNAEPLSGAAGFLESLSNTAIRLSHNCAILYHIYIHTYLYVCVCVYTH